MARVAAWTHTATTTRTVPGGHPSHCARELSWRPAALSGSGQPGAGERQRRVRATAHHELQIAPEPVLPPLHGVHSVAPKPDTLRAMMRRKVIRMRAQWSTRLVRTCWSSTAGTRWRPDSKRSQGHTASSPTGLRGRRTSSDASTSEFSKSGRCACELAWRACVGAGRAGRAGALSRQRLCVSGQAAHTQTVGPRLATCDPARVRAELATHQSAQTVWVVAGCTRPGTHAAQRDSPVVLLKVPASQGSHAICRRGRVSARTRQVGWAAAGQTWPELEAA
jgi:hypothetical protein